MRGHKFHNPEDMYGFMILLRCKSFGKTPDSIAKQRDIQHFGWLAAGIAVSCKAVQIVQNQAFLEIAEQNKEGAEWSRRNQLAAKAYRISR